MTDDFDLPPEMIVTYLVHRQADVEKCRAALKSGDYSVFEKIGHQLKGNGVSFGFPEIGQLGQEMELAGKTKDAAKATSLVTTLEQFVETKLQNLH